MEDQYSDIIKRHEQERENLLGTRYNDIEKLRLMGRSVDEMNRVSAHYDVQQKELAERQEKERIAFLKQPEPKKEPEMTEKMARLFEEAKRRREEQERGRDGYDR